MAHREIAIKFENNDDGHLNSALHQHSFVDGGVSIRFFSYYNDSTPIFYELGPFIKPLRIASVEAAIKILPDSWVRTAAELHDHDLFDKAKISMNETFVQVQSIQYLLNVHEDKVKNRKFIAHLYDLCLTEIENNRRFHERKIIQAMRRENQELKHHTNHHTTTLDLIHDTLHLISERHADIKDAIAQLLDKILKKAIHA